MFKVGDRVLVLKYWTGDIGVVDRVYPSTHAERSYSVRIEDCACSCGASHGGPRGARGAWEEEHLMVLSSVSQDQIKALRNILCSK